MSTRHTAGAIRPKSALSVPQAAKLASECWRLARELKEAAGKARYLKTDYSGIRELGRIVTDLTKAAAILERCHLAAQGMWDAACAEADHGGHSHG